MFWNNTQSFISKASGLINRKHEMFWNRGTKSIPKGNGN